MKVCIVSPSIFYMYGNTELRALYHIPYLYSYLRQHLPGVEVSVVDFEMEMGHINRREEVDEFLRIAEARLRRTDFDIVGISCWTSQHYLTSMAIARLCRRLNPDCKIVVGGYHPTYVPQDFEFPGTPIDYIVLGEGEEAFRRIVAGEIPQEYKPQQVQGIQTQLAELKILWDEYPYYRNASVLGLWLSRGCPFSCGYCLDRQTRYRCYTARQAISEVQRIIHLLPSLRQIQFCDALFGLSKEWRREFLPLLVEMQPGVEFWAETRVDIIQPEDLDYVGRLDFQLDVGLEHVSPRMLTIMKKTNNPKKYLECWETVDSRLNEKWIPHQVFLMFNYPGETSETQQQLYEYWMDYYDKNPNNWTHATPQPYRFYPGAETYNNWKYYEETYGAGLLYPEWWKVPDPRQPTMGGALVPSRELMEANLVHRGRHYTNEIWMKSMQIKHPRVSERRPSGFYGQTDPRLIDRERDGFLDDKPLQLQDLTCLHERANDSVMLYNFETRKSFEASRDASYVLRQVLENGSTLNTLVKQHASADLPPQDYRRKLNRLFLDLLDQQFLILNLAPRAPLLAPPARPRVVLQTTAGRIVLELFATELPKTVANFLYLVRRRYYKNQYFFRALPETFVQAGAWGLRQNQQGPGYTMEYEPSPFPHERGSVSMVREGPTSHGSQFFIWCSPQPQFDGKDAVFGCVVEGMATVDRILLGQDMILEAHVEGEEAPAGADEDATGMGTAAASLAAGGVEVERPGNRVML